MAKVKKVVTTVTVFEVDEGPGFQPMIAVGMAKGLEKAGLGDRHVLVEWHVEEGENAYQVAGSPEEA